MPASLPAIEAWIRVVGLAIGAAVVLIVPVTGFMKEYWAYRARVRESETLRADTARAVPGAMIGQALEMADLTRAVAELTLATRALSARLRPDGPPESRARDGP